MDIITLRVMDSLYKINLTEEEYSLIEDEVSHKERTGYFICAIKKKKIIAVNHDDRHNILIVQYNGTSLKPKNRVLMKTLITFEDIPQEIYTLHTICRYRALDLELKNTANNLEELKKRILERLTDKYPKQLATEIQGEYNGYDMEKRAEAKKKKNELVEKQLKAIYWLFGEKLEKNFGGTRDNISKIVKVFEFKNTRLVIIQTNEKFEKSHGFNCRKEDREICEGVELLIQFLNPKDKRYDYADLGREIYMKYNGGSQVWICDELCGKITEQELDIFYENREGEFAFLTSEVYEKVKNSLKIKMMKARIQEEENKTETKFREKIRSQFENGKVVRNGIEITKNTLTYDKKTLKGDVVEEYINYESPHTKESPDFSNLFEGYVMYLQQRGFKDDRKEIKFKIGNVKVKLKIKLGLRGERSYMTKNYSVNEKRIKKEELTQVIMNSLYFNTQEEYDNFVSDISKESFKLKNALDYGIIFSVKMEKSEDNCLVKESDKQFSFTLKLEKIDNKIYTRIKDKLFRVKSTNALFDLGKELKEENENGNKVYLRYPVIERNIRLINKALENISPKEIGELIKIAEKENIDRIKRSQNFIDNAVKITKAERVERGYIVKGKSGNEYFIGDDLKVYRCKDKKPTDYICIVDYISVKDKAQKNDFIAKRILAMANDLDVKDKIFTLAFLNKKEMEIEI